MDELTLNPRAELVRDLDDDGSLRALMLIAPRRGVPLRTTTVARDEGAVFEVLRDVAAGVGVEFDLDACAWQRLVDIGFLLRPDEVPAAVPFTCPIGDAAPYRGSRDALRVNPALRLDGRVGAPAEAWVDVPSAGRERDGGRGARRVNAYADDRAWAIVVHAHLPTPTAFSLDANDRSLLARLTPGGAVPADLDDDSVGRLLDAGLVEDRAAAERASDAWEAAGAAAVEDFARDRCASLAGLLHPRMVDALRARYRALVAEGYAGFDEALGRNRFCMHNEPVARVIHRALAPLVSSVAGEAVKPSYVYLGGYREGAVLVPHRDRDQCPISVSLLIDYEPTPASQWPLRVELPRPGGPAVFEAYQSPGDGVFFDGTKLIHHRPPLPAGHRSTSLFFHYVPARFEGGLD